jgi:CRISPR-associated endonuclease/helicase Cas3
LDKSASGDISDTEAAGGEEYPSRSASECALRWRGKTDERTELITSDKLRPGDVIIVPAARGGCDEWGWAPSENEPVRDLGREGNLRQRARDILRLTKAELSGEGIGSIANMIDWTDKQILDQFEKYFEESEDASFAKPRIIRSSEGIPLAIERKLLRARKETQADSVGDAVTEDEESLCNHRQKPILLSEHSIGVEKYTRRFAKQAGLQPNLVNDIELAAYLHDAGKAQANFKRLLYSGDELAAVAGPDLAKSNKLPDTPRAWDEARKRAGLPKGARHEVASLRFAEVHSRFAASHDPDLVLWLIGTHHGYGRPFFLAPEWDRPGQGAAMASGAWHTSKRFCGSQTIASPRMNRKSIRRNDTARSSGRYPDLADARSRTG